MLVCFTWLSNKLIKVIIYILGKRPEEKERIKDFQLHFHSLGYGRWLYCTYLEVSLVTP